VDLKAAHDFKRASATEAVGAAATAGVVAVGDAVEAGTGEALASDLGLALDRRTGEPIGDRLGEWVGVHGGTTRIGMVQQSIVRTPMTAGRDTWTIGTTIHRIGLMRTAMDRKAGREEKTRPAVNLRQAT
jgi:hypothetical protein